MTTHSQMTYRLNVISSVSFNIQAGPPGQIIHSDRTNTSFGLCVSRSESIGSLTVSLWKTSWLEHVLKVETKSWTSNVMQCQELRWHYLERGWQRFLKVTRAIRWKDDMCWWLVIPRMRRMASILDKCGYQVLYLSLWSNPKLPAC